jgi:AraC-like DNA-binding protein
VDIEYCFFGFLAFSEGFFRSEASPLKAIAEKIEAEQDSSFRTIRRVAKRFDFHWHAHEQFELTLILQSEGKRFVGDHIGDYRPGDFVLLGPSLPHCWLSQQPALQSDRQVAVVVQFDRAFLGPEFFSRPEMVSVRQLLDRSVTGLAFPLDRQEEERIMMERLPETAPTDRLLLLLKLLNRLSHAVAAPLSSPGFLPDYRHDQHRMIDHVCSYLNENYLEPLEQSAVARMVGMGPARFSQFFRCGTGRTFVQYVNAIRVSHACRLLIETDLSITEVCFKSGFSNVSNFNRRFKEVQTISPSAFRKCHRQVR